ncbi:MAG: class I SAM-dependent methyltransferase [Brockia lithotrophica]|nr:class I SAM-dependent methyltransferase [Brockia lithotrophica]
MPPEAHRRTPYMELIARLGAPDAHPGGAPASRAFVSFVRRLVPPGARVLEVGAGAGKTAARLARLGYCVVAVEREPAFLPILRRRAERRPKFTVVCADAVRLPFPDASFDAIVAESVLLFLPPRALRELRRVLRPGGRLFALELAARKPFPPALRRAWHAFYGVPGVPTAGAWRRRLVRVGFPPTLSLAVVPLERLLALPQTPPPPPRSAREAHLFAEHNRLFLPLLSDLYLLRIVAPRPDAPPT